MTHGILVSLVFAGVVVSFTSSNVLATEQSIHERAIQYYISEITNSRSVSSLQHAQAALEQMGDAAVDPLIAALSSSNPALRRSSAEMLGYIAPLRAADALRHTLINDPDPAVRTEAVWSLSELGTMAVTEWLERAAVLDADFTVRQAAGQALESKRWTLAVSAGKDVQLASAFAVAPSDSRTIYLSEMDDVSVSHDGGQTWTAASPVPSRVASLSVDPNDSSVVYAGTESLGLYKSVDGGNTWKAMSNGLGLDPGVRLTVTAIAIDPDNSNRVYAAKGFWIGTSHAELFPQGVALSLDGGKSWEPVVLPETEQPITRMAIDNHLLYALAGDQVVTVGF